VISLRLAAAVALSLFTAALAGCRKQAPLAERQAAPGASLAAPSAEPGTEAKGGPSPVDRLGPHELPPGTETIYGLTLPEGLRLVAHFPRVAHAVGSLSPEEVANYIRDRVDVRRIELGAVGTVFPRVRVKGGDPQRYLRIEVNVAGDGTELVVRDISPMPELPRDPTLTEEERWRRAGLRPDGTPLNPRELQ